jgi:nucleotide-binding universal stress UspA family protein
MTKQNYMKTILCLTDFSNCATNAVRYAIKLSEAYNTKLVFYYSTYQYILSGMPESYITEIIKDDENEKKEILKKNITKIYQDLKIPVKKVRFIARYSTNLISEIEETIQEEKIDMIVMGTKGATGLSRVLFGSNTARIIDKVSCPVLSIPGNKRFKLFKEIALFSDLTEIETELKDIIPIVKKFKCQLEIYHLDENTGIYDSNTSKLIDDFKKKHRFEGIRLTVVKRIFEKNIAYQIEKIVADTKPDMICLHTIKYNWLEKLFIYSYTKSLVYHAKTCILTFSKRGF